MKLTATIIVVFITEFSNITRSHIENLPAARQVMKEFSEQFKLDAMAVADESYLDELWGHEKIYDPNSVQIAL